MGAETRADSAMAAYDWFFDFLIKVYGSHNAGSFAPAASDAHIFPDQNAASRTFFQSVAWAYFHASRIRASEAYDRDEAAGHAAGSPHPDRALYKRMVFSVSDRANTHAGEASQAFVHICWLKYFCHN